MYVYIYIYIFMCVYIYIYIYIYIYGSFLIRRQRGHPGVVLTLVIHNLANREEGMQSDLTPIGTEPCVRTHEGNRRRAAVGSISVDPKRGIPKKRHSRVTWK